MNKIWVGCFLTSLYLPSVMAQAPLSLEERLAQMEQRLKATEARAASAEAEIKTLKGQQQAATVARAAPASPRLQLNDNGELKFYGDVEFNLDGASRTGSLTSVKTSANKSWAPGDKERWDINGRILLGFDGRRNGADGQYAGFSVQPLADMDGKMNLDDAVFFFGQQDDWKIKIGRFEAWDMFPLNQDTFIEYSGNTANDLYSDGYGYIYMMKEGRGRSSSGGNLLFSKTVDNWYFEVNTLVEDGSSLFVDQNYHGNALENRKNVVYVRPVAAWQSGAWSAAAAIESNLVNNAYGYQSQSGRWVDQSNRTGYGLTMSWNTLKSDPQDGAVVNLSTALLDAADETDFSAGINALWHRVELGYIYAHNKIDQFNMAGVTSECDGDGDCAILAPGRYDIHTLHTSWQLPNIMAMPNFNIYLGAYASWLDSTAAKSGNPDERYGARVRFKYFF
ncbi:TPA: carbohydrate porin [Klebsiella pneumoniae]|nr:carbohydrate porin [Klebsiella pneumoniae]HDU4935476.1 carbohydrate porin [Klebsiella pneumoniae subsp. pneumoniae]EKX4111776.1 carbohydrate porin [Klebsiella pneumoniae]MBG2012270.1 carbohydrate porin [Klebsiella pneumoniae]MCD5809476.1 carbohydrate porin [Klebsiella pneumoniae]MCE7332061.1 carbohydrate porin [Klebsiella pneumoniae]